MRDDCSVSFGGDFCGNHSLGLPDARQSRHKMKISEMSLLKKAVIDDGLFVKKLPQGFGFLKVG